MKIDLDLSDCIELCSLPMTLTRFEAPAVSKGRVVMGLVSGTCEIYGSIQPVSSSELQRLPEGLRVDGTYKLYTEFEIRPGNTAENIPPDRITFEGVDYEVQQVLDWNTTASYYKAILRRLDR